MLILMHVVSALSGEEATGASRRLVTVGSSRLPLLLRLLSQQMGCLITCEEPDYPLLPVPRAKEHADKFGTTFFFEYAADQASKKDIVEKLLRQYEQHDSETRYKVNDAFGDQTFFNVFAVERKSPDGRWSSWTSPLEKQISLSDTSKTYAEVSQEIASLVFGDRSIGDPGMQIGNSFQGKMVLAVKDEQARLVLTKLIRQFNQASTVRRIAWFLTIWRSKPSIVYELVAPPSDNTSLYIEGERPTATAAQFLCQFMGLPITYEESEHKTGLESLAAVQNKHASYGQCELSFNRDEPVVAILLRASESDQRPVRFAVTASGKYRHVVPIAALDAHNCFNGKTSPLEEDVSFSVVAKTGKELLDAFCQAVSASCGVPVSLGDAPSGLGGGVAYTFDAKHSHARACLLSILDRFRRNLTWQLLYDPPSKKFTLNVFERPMQDKSEGRN
jgi:hypothetical protein